MTHVSCLVQTLSPLSDSTAAGNNATTATAATSITNRHPTLFGAFHVDVIVFFLHKITSLVTGSAAKQSSCVSDVIKNTFTLWFTRRWMRTAEAVCCFSRGMMVWFPFPVRRRKKNDYVLLRATVVEWGQLRQMATPPFLSWR